MDSAREKSGPNKEIQFLQEAIYVDKRKEINWSGRGIEERPEIDVEVAMGFESVDLTPERWDTKQAGWGRGKMIGSCWES